MTRRPSILPIIVALAIALSTGNEVFAQFGGGGGPSGGGADAPGPQQRPAFRDFIHEHGGVRPAPQAGDKIVADVTLQGNATISTDKVFQKLKTKKDRFYEFETVLADIRRLHEIFEHATYKLEERPDGVVVHFTVRERPSITKVIYHGNRGINDRDLKGRSGVSVGDPLNEFSIESGRRRLLDYYREEGFNQATISTVMGLDNDPNGVLFRINEGPKERIAAIKIEGSTIVSESRLKKIINSRGPMAGVLWYLNNTSDLSLIDQDVKVLEAYYHNLGFLTATVGRRLTYDESGKWLTVTFVVNEGVRYKVNEVRIIGNRYINTESLMERLTLKPGDQFDGTLMRKDVSEIIYGYGSFGFIYAEVQPQTVMRDENDLVDLVYRIEEGDRWMIRSININVDGDPNLMKDTTLLNQIDLVEGEYINRRTLELNRRRIERGSLLETNPAVADPPDIRVIPLDESTENY
jgi:outer membrane protein insertion porin family